MKLPLEVLGDIEGFGTFGASLGGIVGSFIDARGVATAFGGQLGALWAIVMHLVRAG